MFFVASIKLDDDLSRVFRDIADCGHTERGVRQGADVIAHALHRFWSSSAEARVPAEVWPLV